MGLAGFSKVKKIIKLNSLFTKLMAGFLLVIIVVSSFHVFSYRIYANNIKTEIFDNENTNLDRIINKVENYFSNMQRVLVKLHLQEKFQKTINQSIITPYDFKILLDECSLNTYDIAFYSEFFIYTRKSDYIITSVCTFEKKRFFNRFYRSNKYTEEFWLKQLNDNFTFKIYEGDFFEDIRYEVHTSKYIVPIAFKNLANKDAITIVYIDMEALIFNASEGNTEGLHIANADNRILFPDKGDFLLTELISIENTESTNSNIDYDYVISRVSETSGLKYFRLLNDVLIKNQLKTTSMVYILVFLISFLVSVLISLYIVVKVNNPVRQIGDIVRKSSSDLLQKNIGDLGNIRDYIQKLDNTNTAYMEKISSQNSILQTFFYQSKIKNIYSIINSLKEQITIKNDYFIVYFKIHYKQQFFNEFSADTSEGTYYLKEYIHLKLINHFKKLVTFNMEDNQIVSIINIQNRNGDLKEKIEIVMESLKKDKKYAFFTVVISCFYENISELGNAFNQLVKISRYRKPVSETQIIEESAFQPDSGKIYFSSEQADKLSDILSKGMIDQSIGIADKIIDDNFRNCANSFYLNILCNELVNCCIKSLVEYYYCVPDDFDVDKVISQINSCYVIDEFKEISIDFIYKVATYFSTHEQKKDYIIDYVKDYIEKYYDTDIYLELLADNLNITKAYLSLYFKNKTGINFSDFLKNFRMHKAKEMLNDTSLKIQDISTSIGIPNVNTFIRLFRTNTGMTPGEYRKNLTIQ